MSKQKEGFPRFQPEAVILDMDGLMLDTERPVLDVWIQTGRGLGWEISRDIVFRTIGLSEAGMRALFAGEYGGDFPYDEVHSEVKRRLIEIHDRDGIGLRPGLTAFLDCMADHTIPFAVATSTERKTALWKLEKAGLRERCRLMVCGDEVINGKPAPDIFLAAAAKLGHSPGHCAGFEDSPHGLRGLAAAGIPSVFVKDLVDPPAEVLATLWRRYENLAQAVEIFT
jgi:beta-phosphoglucomutase-like phosphatase (HAD superfamily)